VTIFGNKISIITYVPEKVLDALDYERGTQSRSSFVAGILEEYCKMNNEFKN